MAAEGKPVKASSKKCPVPAIGGGSKDRTKLRTEGEATLFIRKKNGNRSNRSKNSKYHLFSICSYLSQIRGGCQELVGQAVQS